MDFGKFKKLAAIGMAMVFRQQFLQAVAAMTAVRNS